MTKKVSLFFTLFSLTILYSQAQAVDMIFLNQIEVVAESDSNKNKIETDAGLMGTVYDKETLKPLSKTLVYVKKHGDYIASTRADSLGVYKIELKPDTYDVSFVYRDRRDVHKQGIIIKESGYTTVDIFMEIYSIDLEKVIIKGTKVIEQKVK